eukprot:CAMPEP_0183332572 /NCGR_PEP_ID=MMETSP0164_2-20130417/1697_1 /TAXON_ID=221442 /ORGANISM="Coccolithus pelagicus ssp braarudi, Strain PLY182g" /LENGTH=61 /DNA_ID=CAMNT_0025501315 /DNA_START=771 /DNA_END=953 /DNA_ORIENTATION=+
MRQLIVPNSMAVDRAGKVEGAHEVSARRSPYWGTCEVRHHSFGVGSIAYGAPSWGDTPSSS